MTPRPRSRLVGTAAGCRVINWSYQFLLVGLHRTAVQASGNRRRYMHTLAGAAKKGPDGPAGISREEYGRLIVQLEMLCRSAEQVLAEKKAFFPDLQQLAVYVAQIRQMLSELSALPEHRDGRGMPHKISTYLSDRFLELEGRIKELRNDLDQDGKPEF
ncbi:MAG: hypothetical protein ACYC7L_00580 [Nitrospirota bacterium]